MDTEIESILLLHTRNTSPLQIQTLPQSKGLGKFFQSNGLKKQTGGPSLVSNKLKYIKTDKEGYFI